MRKEDIKSGVVVKLRKGCWCLVLDYKGEVIFVNRIFSESELSRYNKDLYHSFDRSFDIVSVASTNRNNLVKLDESEFDIIWERDEAKEMTIEEIEKELGYKIKIIK